jgi:alcohol dehydrogenase class IV
MPYVLHFNQTAIEERIAALAAYAGVAPASFDGFLDWIMALRRDLGIPSTLAELGVRQDQIEKLARMAEEDPSAAGNPLPFDAAAARQVLEAAMRGDGLRR